jgi:hypothetical protein
MAATIQLAAMTDQTTTHLIERVNKPLWINTKRRRAINAGIIANPTEAILVRHTDWFAIVFGILFLLFGLLFGGIGAFILLDPLGLRRPV